MNLKQILVPIFTIVTLNLTAQSLHIGYVQPSSITTVGSTSTKYTANGIQAGITNSTEIQNSLSVNYGILYSYIHGTKLVLGTDASSIAHNIDLPVKLSYKFPLSISGNVPFVYAGPNFTYTISNITKYTILGNEIVSDLYKDDNYSRFNLQLGVGVGLLYKKYTFKAGYDWGMLDLNKSENVILKSNTFSVSLGFLFL